MAAWFSHHTLSEAAEARADARLAQSLECGALCDPDRPHLAEALASGRCSLAQARVIARALDDLPARVGAETTASAEATLVGYAADPRLGRFPDAGAGRLKAYLEAFTSPAPDRSRRARPPAAGTSSASPTPDGSGPRSARSWSISTLGSSPSTGATPPPSS